MASLRQRLLDAVIDGKIGKGIVVTRAQMLRHFKDDKPTYVGSFLPNSEMDAKEKFGSVAKAFVIRVDTGKYQIHPTAIQERMREREALQATG
jgi:hypothetical protein